MRQQHCYTVRMEPSDISKTQTFGKIERFFAWVFIICGIMWVVPSPNAPYWYTILMGVAFILAGIAQLRMAKEMSAGTPVPSKSLFAVLAAPLALYVGYVFMQSTARGVAYLVTVIAIGAIGLGVAVFISWRTLDKQAKDELEAEQRDDLT